MNLRQHVIHIDIRIGVAILSDYEELTDMLT